LICIAPVPLHISRLRERGFNQSLLMLWEWQGDQSKIVPELLIRTRPTKSQVGLSREQRLNNLVSAFRHNSDFNVQGKRILLVDDVYTTGSTVHSCTLPLLKSGADAVNILTLARA
jgi:Predicted amidophosphoribosyltransferases